MRLAVLFLGVIFLLACQRPVTPESSAPAPAGTPAEIPPTDWQINSIEWDDADSGDINGVRFRLYSVDAPETGGVGAAVGGAQCEAERARGLASKEWMQAFTRDLSTLRIMATHGHDRMEEPRLLINLSANGVDVGTAGIEVGHLRPWPHDGSRQLADKPDWCGV